MSTVRCHSCKGTGEINEDSVCLACTGSGESPACDMWIVDDYTCDLPLDHAGPCAYQPPLFEVANS